MCPGVCQFVSREPAWAARDGVAFRGDGMLGMSGSVLRGGCVFQDLLELAQYFVDPLLGYVDGDRGEG